MSDQSMQMNNYLDWLNERGLIHPVLNRSKNASTSLTPPEDPRLLFVVSRPLHTTTLNQDQIDLFNKMVDAMQLNPTDYRIEIIHDDNEWNGILNSNISMMIVMGNWEGPFSAAEKGVWINPHPTIEGGTKRALVTYHPEELLQNPALKRPTWEHLQKVICELKA